MIRAIAAGRYELKELFRGGHKRGKTRSRNKDVAGLRPKVIIFSGSFVDTSLTPRLNSRSLTSLSDDLRGRGGP